MTREEIAKRFDIPVSHIDRAAKIKAACYPLFVAMRLGYLSLDQAEEVLRLELDEMAIAAKEAV